MTDARVRHMVVFSLKRSEGPTAEAFLKDGERLLSAIPGVQAFEVLRQVSSKFDYDYGFSMEFDDQGAYDAYSGHPVHMAFVKERWLVEVARFQEIDFMGL